MKVSAVGRYRIQTFGDVGTEILAFQMFTVDAPVFSDEDNSGLGLNGMLEFESQADGGFTIWVTLTSTFGDNDYVLLLQAI